jgi:mRNA interferase MazF|tara:strand:+ start:355 stop:540 length:186 start_codon:yes stop_codon:yes gene_type:complete
MERFVAGDIVVLDFPFSGLSFYKRRPALIIEVPKGQDLLISQITAESQEESLEISIKKKIS